MSDKHKEEREEEEYEGEEQEDDEGTISEEEDIQPCSYFHFIWHRFSGSLCIFCNFSRDLATVLVVVSC